MPAREERLHVFGMAFEFFQFFGNVGSEGPVFAYHVIAEKFTSAPIREIM